MTPGDRFTTHGLAAGAIEGRPELAVEHRPIRGDDRAFVLVPRGELPREPVEPPDLHDYGDDSGECWKCAGEGATYCCFTAYACVDPEGGCSECERGCDVCHGSGRTGRRPAESPKREMQPGGLRDGALNWLGIAGWCDACNQPVPLERPHSRDGDRVFCEACTPKAAPRRWIELPMREGEDE